MESELQISWLLWLRLVWRLRQRGGGVRESGAFLLGSESDKRISKFICYDDLDPHCLDTGIIRFDGKGYVPLWKHCAEHKLKVLADVHTHPRTWTKQSEADRTHPMISQPGHLALILPCYSQHSWLGPKGAGFYRYIGDNCWETLPTAALNIRFL